jgi:molybdenum cofactor cytidylyltransferase
MCESIRLGVEAAAADHYLFMPCDQPLLDAATAAAVAARRAPGRIVVPFHRGEPGNPVLFSAHFRDELLTLPDGDSPRILKKRHADRVVPVEIDAPLPLRDMDTEKDLRELEALSAR